VRKRSVWNEKQAARAKNTENLAGLTTFSQLGYKAPAQTRLEYLPSISNALLLHD